MSKCYVHGLRIQMADGKPPTAYQQLAQTEIAKLKADHQQVVARLRGALREMRSRFGRTLPCNDPTCLVCPDEIDVTREADAALAETADPPQEPEPAP